MPSAVRPAALGLWAYISGKSLMTMLQQLHIHAATLYSLAPAKRAELDLGHKMYIMKITFEEIVLFELCSNDMHTNYSICEPLLHSYV